MIVQTMVLKAVAVSSAAGWLGDFESWLWDMIKKYYNALGNFWSDVIVAFLKSLTTVGLWVVNHIPAPSFLSTHSIDEFLGNAGPVVGWLCSVMQLSTAMSMIAAAFSFRLLRKLMTLGQW